MSQKNYSKKRLFVGLLTGAAIGSIVALLNTKQSGKDLRADIKQKSDAYLEEVDKYLTETKQNAGKVVDESRRKIVKILHDLKSKPEAMYRDAEQVFNETKEKTIGTINSGKEMVDTKTEKLTSSIKAGIETFNETKKS